MMNTWGIWTFSNLFEKILPFACTACEQFSLRVLPAAPLPEELPHFCHLLYYCFPFSCSLSPVPILELLPSDLLCGERRGTSTSHTNGQPQASQIGLWNACVWWLAIIEISRTNLSLLMLSPRCEIYMSRVYAQHLEEELGHHKEAKGRR